VRRAKLARKPLAPYLPLGRPGAPLPEGLAFLASLPLAAAGAGRFAPAGGSFLTKNESRRACVLVPWRTQWGSRQHDETRPAGATAARDGTPMQPTLGRLLLHALERASIRYKDLPLQKQFAKRITKRMRVWRSWREPTPPPPARKPTSGGGGVHTCVFWRRLMTFSIRSALNCLSSTRNLRMPSKSGVFQTNCP
jgi:hypothetical protein